MERQQVFFDTKQKLYVAEELICDICESKATRVCFWFTDWSKSSFPSGHRFVCLNCIGTKDFEKAWPPAGFSKLHPISEAKTVQIIRHVPIDAQIIADLPPALGIARNTDCFKEAEKELQAHPEKYQGLVSANPQRNMQLDFVPGSKLLEKKEEQLLIYENEVLNDGV